MAQSEIAQAIATSIRERTDSLPFGGYGSERARGGASGEMHHR